MVLQTEHLKHPWAPKYFLVVKCWGMLLPSVELWNQSSGAILENRRWKVCSKIQRNAMGLNAFLPSVIGSVTLSLALRYSFEIGSNHVASLGTLHHFLFPFFVRHLRLIRILIQRMGLNIFFMQVRWSPQVQLVSKASCSTCNSEYFPRISLQV